MKVFGPTTAARRAHEASLLVNFIKGELKADDALVLGGDFNTNSRTEAALITLSSLFNTSGPWPVDQNGRSGTSLNRKEPRDWVLVSPGLSAQAAPTTIGANSFINGFVADTLVYSPISDLMSQVYGGEGGFTGTVFSSDYLELHNRSAVTGTVIPAGGFLLLTLNALVGVAAAVPTPNVSISPAVSLSASSGTVALTTNATQLVGCPSLSSTLIDLVGYGSATCKLGTSTPVLSKVTAATRSNDGCSQRADNNADFSVGGAAPRTSASPAVVCICP